MLPDAPQAPVTVYLIADHLDAALAAGEDLIGEGRAWRSSSEDSDDRTAARIASERATVERLRVAELHLVSRLLAAREHADALATLDKRFAPIARLFVSGTAILSDAASTLADTTAHDFNTADSLIAFARSRALITAECGGMTKALAVPLEDQFQIAGHIPLAATLDMVASFLDALDVQYTLYPEDTDDTALNDGHIATAGAATSAPDDIDEADENGAASEDAIIHKPRSLVAALEEAAGPEPSQLH